MPETVLVAVAWPYANSALHAGHGSSRFSIVTGSGRMETPQAVQKREASAIRA